MFPCPQSLGPGTALPSPPTSACKCFQVRAEAWVLREMGALGTTFASAPMGVDAVEFQLCRDSAGIGCCLHQGPETSLLPGGWVLRLSHAQAQDGGHYSCLASNVAGEARRHFFVDVLGKEGSSICCRIPDGISELHASRDSNEFRLSIVGSAVPESFVPLHVSLEAQQSWPAAEISSDLCSQFLPILRTLVKKRPLTCLKVTLSPGPAWLWVSIM